MLYNERDIAILMADRCTRTEAIKYLTNHRVIIFTADSFIREFNEDYTNICGDEDVPLIQRMIEYDIPAPDWGVCTYCGHKYYICYQN